MQNREYFDSKRDLETIEVGGFFCESCLVGRVADDISPDPRYCKGCYEVLLKEVEVLSVTKRPAWIPKPQKPEKVGDERHQMPPHGQEIMSTLESKRSEVDTIKPAVMTKGKRGPKHKSLPRDLLKKLEGEGMGSKAMAAKLKDDFGIRVSYKTIQRRLSATKSAT